MKRHLTDLYRGLCSRGTLTHFTDNQGHLDRGYQYSLLSGNTGVLQPAYHYKEPFLAKSRRPLLARFQSRHAGPESST